MKNLNAVVNQIMIELYPGIISGTLTPEFIKTRIQNIALNESFRVTFGQKRIVIHGGDGYVYKVAINKEALLDNANEVYFYEEFSKKYVTTLNGNTRLADLLVPAYLFRSTFIIKQEVVTLIEDHDEFKRYITSPEVTNSTFSLDVAVVSFVSKFSNYLNDYLLLIQLLKSVSYISDINLKESFSNFGINKNNRLVVYDIGSITKKVLSVSSETILEPCPVCNSYGKNSIGHLELILPTIDAGTNYITYLNDEMTSARINIAYACDNPGCAHHFDKYRNNVNLGFTDFNVYVSYRNKYRTCIELDKFLNLNLYSPSTPVYTESEFFSSIATSIASLNSVGIQTTEYNEKVNRDPASIHVAYLAYTFEEFVKELMLYNNINLFDAISKGAAIPMLIQGLMNYNVRIREHTEESVRYMLGTPINFMAL